MFLNHVATTTSSGTSQRHIATVAPPSIDLGKTYHSRVCCSKQMEYHCAKASKDHQIR
jgi:hypothetical protein